MMNAFSEYIKSTKAELKHVSWPTRTQATNFTTAVILISIVVSFYLAFFDAVFYEGVKNLINMTIFR